VPECTSDYGKSICQGLGGECVTETDGYYIVSALCLLFGVVFVMAYIIPTAKRLQGKLPVLAANRFTVLDTDLLL
jgi:MFS transporter, PAT family, solute carrier family 33 (acetyl-CoA transportor), member 1